MKKMIVSFMTTSLAVIIHLTGAAQTSLPGSSTNVTLVDCLVSSVKMSDGRNTIQIPENRGSVKLVKRGDRFSDVVYIDPNGRSTKLAPNNGGTGIAPKPACSEPLPDACFGIPNSQNIGMCICKPGNIAGQETYNISLLLPAVQAAREAARRSQK